MSTDAFIHEVRRRLNAAALVSALGQGLGWGAGVLVLGGAACLWRGYPVMGWCFALGASVCALVTAAVYFIRRSTLESAARHADERFVTKDSLVSDVHFRAQSRTGGFYDLVAAEAGRAAERLRGRLQEIALPRKALIPGVLLLAAAAVMSLRKASPEVEERWALEKRTADRSAEVNERMREEIAKLANSLDEADEGLLNKAELRAWAEELRSTKDLKEALRQYALIERRLQEAAERLGQRESAELLRQAGEAVAQDPANRVLGQKLQQKQFEEAARHLAALQPVADTANPEQSRKQNDRLRSAAQRMGQTARDMTRNREGGEATQGQQSQDSLVRSMQSLDDSMRRLDESLRQAAQEKKSPSQQQQDQAGQQQQQQQAGQRQQEARQQLQGMSRQISKAGRGQQLSQRLQQLAQMAGQSQNHMNGSQPGSSMAQRNNPGGKAGQGSVESRRDGRDPLSPHSEVVHAEGMKGDGPSEKSIEPSDSGERAGTRRAEGKEREYQRQVESFVRREDVPAEVREGVKTYFEKIHAPPPPEPQKPPAPLPPPPEPKGPAGWKKAVS